MITQKLVLRLLFLAVLLPVALSVVMATGHLLRSMEDVLWGTILLRIALSGGIVWLITLVLLLLALAGRVAGSADADIEEDSPPPKPMDRKAD